jgi:carbonic anhydrase/acetyltransferase-like protein (isoleucine patch superfamily)
MILEYKGKKPKIGSNVFIAPTATVIGDVEIADGVSIWYGAVLRGDLAHIKVGRNTNIQDNCTVHTDTDKPAVIGEHVTVGHNAVVHGCTVESNCLIGINAVILNDAHIKTGSIVASGSVVKEKQTVGPFHLVAGIPAILKKDLGDKAASKFDRSVSIYLRLAAEHISDVRRVDE